MSEPHDLSAKIQCLVVFSRGAVKTDKLIVYRKHGIRILFIFSIAECLGQVSLHLRQSVLCEQLIKPAKNLIDIHIVNLNFSHNILSSHHNTIFDSFTDPLRKSMALSRVVLLIASSASSVRNP